MKAPIYLEIDGSQTFIKSIINKYKSHLSDDDMNNFNSIKVFNTVEEPLFSGPDVYFCLKKTKKKIDRMYSELLDDEILVKQRVNSKANITNLLTEYGVIHATYLDKSDIAVIFQKFMREVIKQLKENGIATVSEAHDRLAEQLEIERELRITAEQTNSKNIEIADAIYNIDNYDQQNIELNILRRRTMDRYSIYIVDWKLVNVSYWRKYPGITSEPTVKKPPKPRPGQSKIIEGIVMSSDSDSDHETKTRCVKLKLDIEMEHTMGIPQYNFKMTNLDDLQRGDNDPYYLSITNREISQRHRNHYKFIKYIYLDKAKHYRDMSDILRYGEYYECKTAYTNIDNTNIDSLDAESCETPIKKVFKISYSELINARDRTFVKNNMDIVTNIKRDKSTRKR